MTTQITFTRRTAGYYTATITNEVVPNWSIDIEIVEVFSGGYGWRLQSADGSWMSDRAPTLKEAKSDAAKKFFGQ